MAKSTRTVKPKDAAKLAEPVIDAPAPEMMVTRAGVHRRAKNRKTAGKHKGEPNRTAKNRQGEGRPTYLATPEQRALVTVMVAGGIEHRHIATALGISRPTLEKHFKYEIENAAAQANGKVIASLFKECLTGNVRALEFWLTNRASNRWAHKQKVDGHVDMNVQLHDRVQRARKRLKGGGSNE